MQRAITISAIAGIAAFGALAGFQKACSQAPGRPARAVVSSANPTGQSVNSTVASDAAYGQRAGEGRIATPTPEETAALSQSSEAAAQEFGRPNPGRPAYEDPEFQGTGAPAQAAGGGQAQEQAQQPTGEEGGQQQAAEEQFTLSDSFFFDNYTSGSGFGVYGGEAVTSGQPQQLILPSAGANARNVGLPIVPTQPGGAAPSE